MGCFCCGCCLSRKKRKSFPIRETKRETEVDKVFIRHVENIRVTPPPMNRKTISKATMKKKSENNYGTQKQTMKEKNSSDCRTPTSKLFRKSKHMQTPSPLPMTTSEIPKKTRGKPASSCSSSTNSDLPKQKKRSKDRSFVESYNVSKGTLTQKRNGTQARNRSNETKSPAKSKLVLENVRKMIKDQNIQQQHFNHSQQRESARL